MELLQRRGENSWPFALSLIIINAINDGSKFIYPSEIFSKCKTDLSVAGVVDAVDPLHVAWQRSVQGRHPQLSHEE